MSNRISKQRPAHTRTKKIYVVKIHGISFDQVLAYTAQEAKQKVWDRIRRRLATPAIINMTAVKMN